MKLNFLAAMFALLAAATVPLSAGTLSPCDSGAFTNLVSNCGFETGDFTDWITGGNFQDTEVVSGPFYDYAGANSGTDYLVMGAVGSDGSISQSLATKSGTDYTFSFYFASVGDSPSDFTASWDGTPVLSLTDPNTGSTFTQFTYSVVGTGADTIQFSFRDDPAYTALDDIAVTSSSSTPEPGTLALLFAGLGGVIFTRRRRRA